MAIVVMFIVLVLYGSYDSHKAHEAEKRFCASVSVGMPIAGLQEKAIAMGADKRMTMFYDNRNSERFLMIVFHGVFIFDRYMCDISIDDEKVKLVKQTHMD